MYLRHISYALPSWKVSTTELSDWFNGDEKFITEKIGIESRYYLSPDESLTTLTYKAFNQLLNECPGLSKESIDLIVLVTQNPDYKLPHSSALIQDALQIPVHSACFDISLGCSGWVYGLTSVKGFMATQNFKNGILLTCDPYSRIMRRADKNTVSIFGDAASATWISIEKGADIGIADFGTDGSGFDNLIVRSGGSKNPIEKFLNEDIKEYTSDDLNLYMNGRSILEFMLRKVPPSIGKCLQLNGLDKEEIDYYVFHQASDYMLRQLGRVLDLEEEKLPIEIKNLGNTVSSTIPITIKILSNRKKLTGKNILVSGFGVGLSWATNILRY